MAERIEIDGAEGEGGGQVLRSSLALSILTGTPVRIFHVRAGRARPGLMRQHLTAVRAAARVGAAYVEGDELGSQDVTFEPSGIVPGHHDFSVGTAGSTTLVLQTVMWPLLMAPGPSVVTVEGGTHNPMAPPVDFMRDSLLPRLAEAGFRLALSMQRAGFYPAGGGRIEATFEGNAIGRPVEWTDRGTREAAQARALVANLPQHIAERELDVVHHELGWSRPDLHAETIDAHGPGNVLMLHTRYAHGSTVVSSIGQRGVRAEQVAKRAVAELRAFEAADVPIDEHLADQVLIGLALAGGGRFRTLPPTPHTTTNAAIIERFLPVSISFHEGDDGAFRVEVRSR